MNKANMTRAQRINARQDEIWERCKTLARDQAELARRKANAPLKPSKPQSSCDIGLFSDDSKQTDLVEYFLNYVAKRTD